MDQLCQRKPGFGAFIHHLATSAAIPTEAVAQAQLANFLITPVQRLPRYQMLLKVAPFFMNPSIVTTESYCCRLTETTLTSFAYRLLPLFYVWSSQKARFVLNVSLVGIAVVLAATHLSALGSGKVYSASSRGLSTASKGSRFGKICSGR